MEATRGMARLRLLLGFLAVAGLLSLVGLGILWILSAPAGGEELTETQWRRLVGRFGAYARADPSAVVEPAAVAAAVLADPEPEPDVPALRIDRPEPTPDVLAGPVAESAASRPKTVLELQQFRSVSSIAAAGAGRRQGQATLVNLNPTVNSWYLLQLRWADGSTESYHLSNARPDAQDLLLDADFPSGIVIADTRRADRCALWSDDAPRPLADAVRVAAPYVLLCDEQVSLRLHTSGRRSRMERVTDFLRDNIWGGEAITVFVRETLYKDAFLSTSEVLADSAAGAAATAPDAPPPARVDSRFADDLLRVGDLGLPVEARFENRLRVGAWHSVRGSPGVWASAIQAAQLDPEILRSHRDVVAILDEVENQATAYLVAFDLSRFELGYALGTDHPRVDWSDRVAPGLRPAGQPGPDGLDTVNPLVSTGIVPPWLAPRVAATFTAGYKRSHGAFKYGDLATRNNGSHYGFVESGTVFSKLHPGLATIWVGTDRVVQMGTWTSEANAGLERIVHARQNGVPLIDRDPTTGEGVPGALLSRYGPGNWSGSQDGRYRTLRAGACLVVTTERRYLIYGYFSSATPSAMARIFQAYGCAYAMLLDMNALEHTYLATYRYRDGQLAVSHLIDGMSVLDKVEGEVQKPRFVAFSDNRDFFYLLRRADAEGSE